MKIMEHTLRLLEMVQNLRLEKLCGPSYLWLDRLTIPGLCQFCSICLEMLLNQLYTATVSTTALTEPSAYQALTTSKSPTTSSTKFKATPSTCTTGSRLATLSPTTSSCTLKLHGHSTPATLRLPASGSPTPTTSSATTVPSAQMPLASGTT